MSSQSFSACLALLFALEYEVHYSKLFSQEWDGAAGPSQEARVSVLSSLSCGEHDILSVLVRAVWSLPAVPPTGTPALTGRPASALRGCFLINLVELNVFRDPDKSSTIWSCPLEPDHAV